MAENVNQGDRFDMRIFFEAKTAAKVTKAPTLKVKNYTNNSILLTWNEVANAEKYVIYRSLDKSKWTTVKTVNDLSYVDEGLTYGKTYYYKVKAANAISSKTSAVVSGKTLPNKVTNLTVKSGGTKNINLTWDKVSVTGYEVYSSINKKTWYKVATITKNATITYNNKSLKANTTVRAYKTVSGKKVFGPYSAVLSTKTAPVAPTVTLKLKDLTSMNLVIKETKGASSYVIEKSLDGTTYNDYEVTTKAETIVVSEHEIGKTYYYRVRACNSKLNCSGWKVVSLKQTTKAPGFKLTTTSKKVTITLNNAEGADGYQVYRATSKTGKYTLVKTVTSLEEMTVIDKTTKGKTYYYKVRSYKVVDEKPVYSPFSGIKNITSK